MPLENPQFISDLIETNPALTDDRSQGANHLQNIKRAIKQTFPAITGAVTLTQDEINDLPATTTAYTDTEVSNAITAEEARADGKYALMNGDATQPFASSEVTSAGEGTFFDGTAGEVTITDILNEITALKTALYPIGSIYYNGTDGTNPATLLGFGTWQRYGAGRVMIGYDLADPDYDSAGITGGAKTTTLTAAQVPAHSHTVVVESKTSDGQGGTTTQNVGDDGNAGGRVTLTTNSQGGGGAHSNMQPYIVVHAWIRTA